MKLLFLDIDGVMTNDDTIINPNHICSFSKSCVEVLNQILQTHHVKIILTSSWRKENPSHFLILDDMEVTGFPNNFLRINPATGLTPEHLPEINRILNKL
jgi:hypothetical protein